MTESSAEQALPLEPQGSKAPLFWPLLFWCLGLYFGRSLPDQGLILLGVASAPTLLAIFLPRLRLWLLLLSVMLAGRSLYSGYPYFTVTAGYDAGSRENVMKRIYSAVNRDELRDLAISENIDYIVIEEQNRTAAEYNLNEQIFHDTFPVVFIDAEKNIIVFKVQ